MPRMVRFDKTDPIRIDPASLPLDAEGKPKPLFICACGISAKHPFCDGSHKACRTEQPGHLYVYEPGTTIVIDQRPEPPGPS